MANSVSNDALWEKLSEISGQIKGCKQAKNAPDFNGMKDEIIAEINEQAKLLGMHNDINFKANNDNIARVLKKTEKVEDIVSRIRKQREAAERQAASDSEQQLEPIEMQVKDNREYFNVRFLMLRKTSVVITILDLLVLTLTLFCMKQQNDYTLLNDKYYRKSIVIREMQIETDSLRNVIQSGVEMKR